MTSLNDSTNWKGHLVSKCSKIVWISNTQSTWRVGPRFKTKVNKSLWGYEANLTRIFVILINNIGSGSLMTSIKTKPNKNLRSHKVNLCFNLIITQKLIILPLLLEAHQPSRNPHKFYFSSAYPELVIPKTGYGMQLQNLLIFRNMQRH